MNDVAYKEINTFIRTKELSLLSPDILDQIASAPSFSQALQLLQGSPYHAEELVKAPSGDVENMLMQHLQEVYHELFQVAHDPSVIELYSLRYSYHNLKVLLKEHYLNEDLEQLLIPIGSISVRSLKNLVETNQSDVAHPIMVEAVVNAKHDYEEQGLLEAITVYLDTYFLRHLRALTEQINHPPITEMTDTIIDLYNLSSVIRSTNQKKPRSHLYTILSSAGSISKKAIIEEAANGPQAVVNKLYEGNPYSDKLKTLFTDKGSIQTTQLDALQQDILSIIAERGLYEPFGPMALAGYLFAKETEVTNLRLLLVGKQNDISSEKLKERMRTVYGA